MAKFLTDITSVGELLKLSEQGFLLHVGDEVSEVATLDYAIQVFENPVPGRILKARVDDSLRLAFLYWR